MRERRDRAYGPYKHRNKWRVVVIGADGARITATYSSFQTASRRITEVNTEAVGRTVNDAIDAYLEQMTAKPRSIKTIGHRLRGLLGERDRMLRQLTPKLARDLFEARAVNVAGDTQKHELSTARSFAAWCIGKGWIRENPFVGLKPTKPRKRGKPQLRIDEAKKLLDTCLAEDSKAATAVALSLLCGMRASSVTNRSVRDLDNGASVIWIEHDKSTSGERRLEVPMVLRDRLAKLAGGRNGDERLFVGTNRDWLRYHTRRLCKVAGVAIISPHSIRGTHASIARGVVPVEHVAQVLGHSGTSVTRRHYLAPGLERSLDQQAVIGILMGKPTLESVPQ